ncbi:MAG: hypothetical protein ACLFTK_06495 [Anaerolineales bacterium]
MALGRLWAWYTRIGPPVDFHTTLSVPECQARLKAETVPWENRIPVGAKPYRLRLAGGFFWLRNRRVPTERPFQGRLVPRDDGGTQVTGQVINNPSFLGFILFLLVAAPLMGGAFYGTGGAITGLVITLFLFAGALYSRYVEETSPSTQRLHLWLQQTLKR